MSAFDSYSWSLSTWINDTKLSEDPEQIEAIRALWDGERWESILKKASYEDSTWHVWWCDGVNAYAQLDIKTA